MAYVIKSGKSNIKLDYLPKPTTIKNGREVILDYYKPEQESEVHEILRYIVNDKGNSYPQEDMSKVEDFRAYYLSHDVFVVYDKDTAEVRGAFHIKPNFPGRCSHICNAGFIVKKTARELGVGSFMVENYLIIAKDLGYRASFFNLVFMSNEASMRLWKKFGFKEIGIVPKAGNLKGIGYADAMQYYYDFTESK